MRTTPVAVAAARSALSVVWSRAPRAERGRTRSRVRVVLRERELARAMRRRRGAGRSERVLERVRLDAKDHDELVARVVLHVEVRVAERRVDEAIDHARAVERPRHDLLVLRGVGVEDVRRGTSRPCSRRPPTAARGARLRVIAGSVATPSPGRVHLRRVSCPRRHRPPRSRPPSRVRNRGTSRARGVPPWDSHVGTCRAERRRPSPKNASDFRPMTRCFRGQPEGMPGSTVTPLVNALGKEERGAGRLAGFEIAMGPLGVAERIRLRDASPSGRPPRSRRRARARARGAPRRSRVVAEDRTRHEERPFCARSADRTEGSGPTIDRT